MDNRNNEKISAFADGELDDGEVEAALAALRDPEARAAWDRYHRIGDALRSDDLSFGMSAGFASKMAERLEREPALLAPSPQRESAAKNGKRFWLPGIAAAAAVVIAWIATPYLITVDRGVRTDPVLASAPAAAPEQGAHDETPLEKVKVDASVAPASAHDAFGEKARLRMLRDPDLDEYLLAHQRFSPSPYSAAQYARSAAFAADQ